MLDLVQCRFVQMEVFTQRRYIPRLLANDLGCGILYDPRAVNSGIQFGSDKILRRLAHTPDTRITFSRCAKQLDDFRSQHRRIEQEPTFIEDRDAATAGFA